MYQQRIPETYQGIQAASDVMMFDSFARTMRDRGQIQTDNVIASGIVTGGVLEVGPGPGYLGLEWLKKTQGTSLTGIEISPNMIQLACSNRAQYSIVEDRAAYVRGNAMELPFADGSFDGAFSNGSLHEWEHPEAVFAEISRILKPGGRFFVSDLRRDLSLPVRLFLFASAKANMRHGLKTSLQAAYTVQEMNRILAGQKFSAIRVQQDAFGLVVSGQR
jgi:ubiquinone/menaquinone biosynthesis C-methylase UbiE